MNLGKNGTQEELDKKNSNREKKKSRKVFTGIFTFFTVMLLIACIGIAVLAGMVKGIIDDAPRISNSDIIPKEQMSKIYDSEGNLLETLVQAGSNRTNVKDYNTIPINLINAFVAIEDSRFWEHNGIDLKGIARSAYVVISSGFKRSEGGSTITQQLIKNSIFTNWLEEDSWGDKIERKIQEQYLAIQLEKEVSKEDILLSYLNTINLGNNSLGIAQASKRYFGKEYTELTLSECAVLAGITNNPSKYNPIRHPDYNRDRMEKVLKDMEEQGYISAEQHQEALDDDVYERIAATNETYTVAVDTPNSYFVDSVIKQVSEDLQKDRGYTQQQATNLLYSGGLQIYTTLDPTIQNIIDEEVNDASHYSDARTQYSCTFKIKVTHSDGSSDVYNEAQLKQYFRSKDPDFKFIAKTEDNLNKYIDEYAATVCDEDKGDTWELTSIDYTLQPQVSFVLMDQHTGYVLGISGGRGKKTTNLSLNRATSSTRSPGSLFKVLAAFTPALDSCGNTLGTVYYDGPYSIGEKNFSNYWSRGYMGYSTIRQAIMYSMNIVTLKCMNETVTPALAFEYLEKFGFTTLVESYTSDSGKTYSDINPSLCLGGLTNGVTNLETTAAYAAIANGGVYNEPIFYTKILDSDGNVIIDNEPESHTVMKETTAYLLTNAMQDTMDGPAYKSSGNVSKLYATGRPANFSGMSLAGKTGTTTGTCDIWFAGFSPYYTAVVWSGFDEMQEIPDSNNVKYHKEIWKTIMQRVHNGLPDTGFKAPAGIVSKTICSKSGKLAIEGVCDSDPRGNMTYTEYYTEDTVPTEVCDKHVGISVCAVSGLRAGANCTNITTKVFMSLDADASGESDDKSFAMGSLGTCTADHMAESIAASQSASESAAQNQSSDSSNSEDQNMPPGIGVPNGNSSGEHQQGHSNHNENH